MKNGPGPIGPGAHGPIGGPATVFHMKMVDFDGFYVKAIPDFYFFIVLFKWDPSRTTRR